MALQTSVTIAGEKCLGDANNGYVFAIVPQGVNLLWGNNPMF